MHDHGSVAAQSSIKRGAGSISSIAQGVWPVPRQMKWIACAVVLLALSIRPVSVFAQQTAAISGVLVDSSGAGVPGASMALTNQDTAVEVMKTNTDSGGAFSFLAVPAPGSYSISVQVAGFAAFQQKDIVVTVGERRSVGTLTLVLGSVSAAVSVEAAVTPVQTQSAERSADLDKHEISALLARGLNFAGLMRSLPGLSGGVDPTSPAGNSGQAYSALNGARASVSLPTMDGVNATDPSSQGQLYGAAAIDTLSEINVKTSNYQAEYGGSAGGNVNLTTKSGTKDFHGSVYSYLRNEDLNANDYFNNLNHVKKAIYRYVTGGASIGGPVPLRGRFKDKIFFFFNDQYLYNGNPGSLQELTMPTALERTGNFSQSLTVGGALIPVYTPGTKTPYPGNIVPQSQISTYGQDILNMFFLPNFNNRAVTGGNYNYVFQDQPTNRSEQWTTRVDYQISQKLRFYGRDTEIMSHNEGYSPAVADGPGWGLMKGYYDQHIKTPAVNFLYTITPTLINETTFGMNHWTEPGGPLTNADLAKAQRSTYGLQDLGQWYPSVNPLNYMPAVAFSDVPSAAGFSYDSRNPIRGATTIFTFVDNITKVYGKHTIKAGTTISRSRAWKGNQGSNYSGSFQFGKDVNNPLDTDYGYANAIQGVYDTYQEVSARPGADIRSGSFEEFVQDSWKVATETYFGIGNPLYRVAALVPAFQYTIRLQPRLVESSQQIRALPALP